MQTRTRCAAACHRTAWSGSARSAARNGRRNHDDTARSCNLDALRQRQSGSTISSPPPVRRPTQDRAPPQQVTSACRNDRRSVDRLAEDRRPPEPDLRSRGHGPRVSTRLPQVSGRPQAALASPVRHHGALDAGRACGRHPPQSRPQEREESSWEGRHCPWDLREDPLRATRQEPGAGGRQLPRLRWPPPLCRPQQANPGTGRAAAARSPPRPRPHRDSAGAHGQPVARPGRPLADVDDSELAASTKRLYRFAVHAYETVRPAQRRHRPHSR